MKRVLNWVEQVLVSPVLLYRYLKFGCSFRRIYLGQGYWTIVDPMDYYALKDFKWWVRGNGTNLYAARNSLTPGLRNRTVYLHRQIMDPPRGLVVDHKNCNSLDNRRANLRHATRSQNMQNRRKRKNTSSRYIGVHFDKNRNRWAVHIRHNGKKLWLGRFVSESDAARAYDTAARKYHKEFARLNFS